MDPTDAVETDPLTALRDDIRRLRIMTLRDDVRRLLADARQLTNEGETLTAATVQLADKYWRRRADRHVSPTGRHVAALAWQG